jgi:hypothetical protein
MNGLEETLSGELAQKYGALPKMCLPGDDEMLIGFIRALLRHLLDKGLYRRDKVPVVPFMEKKRLLAMEPAAFRSWVENHVACYKLKYDRDGAPFDVLRSMPKEVAEAVLESMDFWTNLLEVEHCHPVPKPLLRPDGALVLLEPGYDAGSKTLTFDGVGGGGQG